MPETVTIHVDVRLASGPAWSSTRQIAVDAVDLVDVVVEHGAADLEVPIQPGGAVQLVLVSPDPASDELSYTTTSGGSKTYKLDQPHLLLGEGGIGMLEGSAAPTSLFFTKTGTSDARVSILVGRNLGP